MKDLENHSKGFALYSLSLPLSLFLFIYLFIYLFIF